MRISIAALLLALPVCATDYYVDNEASGANDGTTRADAWQTLGAITGVAAGDVIYIDEGDGTNYGTFTPPTSGTATTVAGMIWYVGEGENQPKMDTVSHGSEDYLGFVNINFDGGDKTGKAFDLDSSGRTGWLIQDCTLQRWGQPIDIPKDLATQATYFVIRGNTFVNNRAQDGTGEYQIVIAGDYHLVEYNTFEHGGDAANIMIRESYIRNNYRSPMEDSDLDGADPHADFVQYFNIGGGYSHWTEKIVVEGNYDREHNTSNSHFLQLRDNTLVGTYGGLIARLNVVFGFAHIGENEGLIDFRVHNNTFYRDTVKPAGETTGYRLRRSSVTAANNIYNNNSWTRVNSDESNALVLRADNSSAISANNNQYFESDDFSSPSPGSNNTDADPVFVDANPDGTWADFLVPDTGSPLLNNQLYLTEAVGGSTGTSLTVDDAEYFSDGFGITKGDVIKIGSGDWVEITGIDYGTNVITLEESRTWSDNDDVYLYGTEVIGARQDDIDYSHVTGLITLATPNTLAVTGEVRFVQWYEDGVPQEIDYDTPYQYTDGGGEVTAKVYSLFANPVPVVDAVVDPGTTDAVKKTPASGIGLFQ